MNPLIYKMGLFFKSELQQMWTNLSDELDGVDDHVRKWRAVLENEREEEHE